MEIANIKLPNKPLNNIELKNLIKKLKITNFRGVFMRNELPKTPRSGECGIMNLDDTDPYDNIGSETAKGTHWVCWKVFDSDVFYFDSFGIIPPEEFKSYFHNYSILYNTKQIQQVGTVICGHSCLHFLHLCK